MTSPVPGLLRDIRQLSDQLVALGVPFPALRSFPLEGMEAIERVEAKTGMPVPRELRALLQETGGFFIRMNVDGFALTLQGRPTCPQPFGGLADVLDGSWFWNDYRDEGDFPPGSMQAMNAEYTCFGHCELDENAWEHFFYDRQGRFGVLHFDQEFGRPDAWRHLLELSTGKNSQPPCGLDEILVPRLTRAKAAVADFLRFHQESWPRDG